MQCTYIYPASSCLSFIYIFTFLWAVQKKGKLHRGNPRNIWFRGAVPDAFIPTDFVHLLLRNEYAFNTAVSSFFVRKKTQTQKKKEDFLFPWNGMNGLDFDFFLR